MLTQEQITKVKSLGCLRDKTTDDCFNVRILTINGKLKTQTQEWLKLFKDGQNQVDKGRE